MIDKQDLLDVRSFLKCLEAGSKGAAQKDKKDLKAKEDKALIERLLSVVDIKLSVMGEGNIASKEMD